MIAILQANLGGFDTPQDPVKQNIKTVFHRWTDKNFPPCVGLTPRLQYRIPKLFGWELMSGFDYYIWLDGSVTLKRQDSTEYFLNQLGNNDIGFFKHPTRRNIRQEVAHIEEHLQLNKPYITPRYKGGFHKEHLTLIQQDKNFKDDKLYATTMFIYRNNNQVQEFMKDWWYHQSRYFSCDQIPVPYLLWKHNLKVSTFDQPIYKTGYMSLVSNHK